MSSWTPAQRKAWLERNPSKTAECCHAYYLRNKEKYAARARAWKARNRAKTVAYNRRWREKNPEKYREQNRRNELAKKTRAALAAAAELAQKFEAQRQAARAKLSAEVRRGYTGNLNVSRI